MTYKPKRCVRSTSRARHVIALALLTLAASLLAGCGSSGNGIASKTPQEILQASQAAIKNASSVTINSKASQGRLTFTSDLKLTRHGGHATIALLSLRTEVIKTGDTVYFKGSPALYRRLEIKAPPVGTWLKAPATGEFAQFTALTNLAGEATQIISTSGKITKGQTTTIAGEPALELKTEGKLYKGRLYIKTTGEPYPLKLEKTGRETGRTSFTNWNETPAPAAPTNTTTISG